MPALFHTGVDETFDTGVLSLMFDRRHREGFDSGME